MSERDDHFQSLLAEANAQGGSLSYKPLVSLPAPKTVAEAQAAVHFYASNSSWNSPAAQFRSALEQSYGPSVKVADGGSYIPLARVGQYAPQSPQAESFASAAAASSSSWFASDKKTTSDEKTAPAAGGAQTGVAIVIVLVLLFLVAIFR